MLGIEGILHGTHLGWNLYLFLFAEKYDMIKQYPFIVRVHSCVPISDYTRR